MPLPPVLGAATCYSVTTRWVYNTEKGTREAQCRANVVRVQGVLGGLVTEPSFLDAIGRPSASFLGTIVALYNIGCLAGCISAALFGNRLGRKHTILVGSVIMVVGGIIQTATYGASQLIIGRLISGLGNGIKLRLRYGTSFQVQKADIVNL